MERGQSETWQQRDGRTTYAEPGAAEIRKLRGRIEWRHPQNPPDHPPSVGTCYADPPDGGYATSLLDDIMTAAEEEYGERSRRCGSSCAGRCRSRRVASDADRAAPALTTSISMPRSRSVNESISATS